MEALNLKHRPAETAGVSPDLFSDCLTAIFPYRWKKCRVSESTFSKLQQLLAAYPSPSQALCWWMPLEIGDLLEFERSRKQQACDSIVFEWQKHLFLVLNITKTA